MIFVISSNMKCLDFISNFRKNIFLLVQNWHLKAYKLSVLLLITNTILKIHKNCNFIGNYKE